jgi:hypothetical protein
MNFECHITVDTKHAELAAVTARRLHWKTSEIARDPVLGDKNFFYLTTHADNVLTMFNRMNLAAATLRNDGIEVLREKIELIIHDTKGAT